MSWAYSGDKTNTTLPLCFQYRPYYFVSVAVFWLGLRLRKNTGHLNKILVPIMKTPGNIVYLLYTWINWFLYNTDYVQKFLNSNMFEVFINLSNVKADGRIVWCLLINWLRRVLKFEQFIIKWNSPSSLTHQLHFLCSLGIPLWHPVSTGCDFCNGISQVIVCYCRLMLSNSFQFWGLI